MHSSLANALRPKSAHRGPCTSVRQAQHIRLTDAAHNMGPFCEKKFLCPLKCTRRRQEDMLRFGSTAVW